MQFRSSAAISSTLLITSCLLLGANLAAPAQAFPISFEQGRIQIKQQPTPSLGLPTSIANRIRRTVARQIQVPVRELRIVQANQQTWTDGCLGLGRPEELCMASMVRGWRVSLTNGQQTWIYRTDATGRSLRAESQTDLTELSQGVSDRVLQTAATQTKIPVSNLKIAEAERRTWDGCLGIQVNQAACTQIAILGWRVIVSGEGQSWVYHTNGDGSDVRLNEAVSGAANIRLMTQAEQPPALPQQVVFRSIASGGITGSTYETLLYADGRVVRSLLNDRASFPPQTHRISLQQVQQFQQLLQQQTFDNFNGLSYPVQNAADFITITLSNNSSSTQYVDLIKDQLPAQLQQIVQAWDTIAQSP